MTQLKNEIELKGLVISNILNYKYPSYPTSILVQELGFDYITAQSTIHQLIQENLIENVSGQKDLIILTENGKRAANIGYQIYNNEVEEESRQTKEMAKEKARLELKALQFNDTWKWTIILSAIVSVAGLVIAIMAYLKDK